MERHILAEVVQDGQDPRQEGFSLRCLRRHWSSPVSGIRASTPEHRQRQVCNPDAVVDALRIVPFEQMRAEMADASLSTSDCAASQAPWVLP